MSIEDQMFEAVNEVVFNFRKLTVQYGPKISFNSFLYAIRAHLTHDNEDSFAAKNEEHHEILKADTMNLHDIVFNILEHFNKDHSICRDGTISTLKFDKFTITLDLSSQNSPMNSNGESEHTVK